MKKLLITLVLSLCSTTFSLAQEPAAFWVAPLRPAHAVSPNAHFFDDAVIGRSGRTFASIGYACAEGTEKSMVLYSDDITKEDVDWKECPYFTLNEIVAWNGDKRIQAWDVSLDNKLYVCERYRLHELADPLGEGRILLDWSSKNKNQHEDPKQEGKDDESEKMLAVHTTADGKLFLLTTKALYKSTGNFDSFEAIFTLPNIQNMSSTACNLHKYFASNYDRTQSYVIFKQAWKLEYTIYDLNAEEELSPLYESWDVNALNHPAVDDAGNLYFTEWINWFSGYPKRHLIVCYDKENKVYHKQELGINLGPEINNHYDGLWPLGILPDRTGHIYLSTLNYDEANYSIRCGLRVAKLGESNWEGLAFQPLIEDNAFYGDINRMKFKGIDDRGYFYMLTNVGGTDNRLLVSASANPIAWEWTSVISPLSESKLWATIQGEEIVLNSPDEALNGELYLFAMDGLCVAKTACSGQYSVRIPASSLSRGTYLISATGYSGKRLTCKLIVP